MADLQKLGHELLKGSRPDLEEGFYEEKYILGKTILRQRISKGITQEGLARICEVPLQTIHRVEGGYEKIESDIYSMILNKLHELSKENMEIDFSKPTGNEFW